MYCTMCGAENPEYGRYCYRCGSHLSAPALPAQTTPAGRTRRNWETRKQNATAEERERIITELLPIDLKHEECQSCGKWEGLRRYPFGLGKVLATKRSWLETGVSVAVSAISIPLVGYGAFQLPGKSAHLRLLRLELVLCEICLQKQVGYSAHPWWHKARELGYTEFLKQDDLEKLKPI